MGASSFLPVRIKPPRRGVAKTQTQNHAPSPALWPRPIARHLPEGTKLIAVRGKSVWMFDRRDLVFYSEFLALPVGETFGIGQGAVGFAIDGFLKAAVTGPEVFNLIVGDHGSS
jgi:hypothetical protein